MYVDLDEYVESLLEKPLGDTEVANVRIAQHQYQNLRAYRDHLGVVRLCTSEVNRDCDNIHITHRGDNNGSSLEVLPYLIDKQIHIYADPPIYVVGQRNLNGFGETPLPDWRELLEDAGLGLAVISKVRWYLRGHPPIDYKDVPD